MAGAAAAQAQTPMAPLFKRGIAGVASTSDDSGIKVYNGKENYREWEFVYEYKKDEDLLDTAADTRPLGTMGTLETRRPGSALRPSSRPPGASSRLQSNRGQSAAR